MSKKHQDDTELDDVGISNMPQSKLRNKLLRSNESKETIDSKEKIDLPALGRLPSTQAVRSSSSITKDQEQESRMAKSIETNKKISEFKTR